MLNEVVFLQARYNFEMSSQHIQGACNRTSDVLSRMHLGKKFMDEFLKMKQKNWIEDTVKTEMTGNISLFQICTRVKLCTGCKYLMNSAYRPRSFKNLKNQK